MTQPSRFIIGVDTGGTYTDAIVIDPLNHKILAAAKAVTTKGNLAVGIGEAMHAVLQDLSGRVTPSSIASISISTTLATNAVVEGHGNPVAAVLIGFDDGMVQRTGITQAFPGMPILRIAGGHDHNGEETAKLDIAALAEQCGTTASQVSAFAVASAFAVRNASHEKKARETITRATGLPVTTSTEIASALDAPRRALTAVLNARLIARITGLIAAVRDAARHLGIDCPLMIVRGDGSLADANAVASTPIETVLSGPAASLIGARWLSGRDGFIMSDIGGTTTDIATLLNGQPRIAPNGASVGGWRTMVRAIDIKTLGLGGDSEVAVGVGGEISIGPSRALPVSLLASRHPETLALLEADLSETEGGSLLGKFVILPFGTSQLAANAASVSDKERAILSQIGPHPVALRKVASSSAALRTVQSLRRKGLLQYATFTPSDACHVLNKQANWSREAAVLAAKLLFRFRTMSAPGDTDAEAVSTEVWSRTVELSCEAIIAAATGVDVGKSPFVTSVTTGAGRLNLASINISPVIPVIAVGGPAKVFYEEVGRRLKCEVEFPEHFDVANAVGAAAGTVQHSVEASIEGNGQGLFRVFVGGETLTFTSGVRAMLEAGQRCTALAMSAASSKGAFSPSVNLAVTRNLMPEASDDEGLLTASLIATASGQPVKG